MKERMKMLRTTLNISQESFGKTLGVTKSAISKIECGENNLTDAMIKLIVTQYNVNETWLRTGRGNMFNAIKKEEDFNIALEKLLSHDDDFVKKTI